MIFGRTELRIGLSKAKNDQESFAEVHLSVSLQNPDENRKKQDSESEKSGKKNVRGRKVKCWGSSETCFGKV